MIIKKLVDELNNGEVIFPTTINLALKIKKEVEDDDAGVAEVAKSVQKEPVLTAKTLRLANSTAYNQSGKEIVDISMAISKIGLDAVKMLVMTLIVRQMTGSKLPEFIKTMAAETWKRAAESAANAYLLAKQEKSNPNVAMSATLIKYLPEFYMLSRLGIDIDEKQINAERLAKLIEEHSHIVAGPLMKSLKTPSEIVSAVLDENEGVLARIIKNARNHEECTRSFKEAGIKDERDLIYASLC